MTGGDRGGLAFYAPMKPPDDPRPSGDRAMARALLRALDHPRFARAFGAAALASTLKSRDGEGAAAAQDAILAAAAEERKRLAAQPTPRVWLTYHCYYKAPDLLGPAAAEQGALYAIIEASRSAKRLEGPWARFAEAAETAIGRADVLFYMTERDRPALEAAIAPGQALRRLRPFIDLPADAPLRRPGDAAAPIRLLAVGMMRPGDKSQSYAALFKALARLRCDWRLEVVGDGPARAEVEAMAAGLGPAAARVTFRGQLEGAALRAAYAAADLFVWPGVNEAYGLVYLEAQAQGLAVLAEDRPGVRDVARDGALRTPPEDPSAFAGAIEALAGDRARLEALAAAGRAQVLGEHSLDAARETLFAGLAEGWARKHGAPP